MVRVSSAARKSKLLSAALNVAVTDPENPGMSVLTDVVSADASTALSPLGSGSAEPDQVIETRLALAVPLLTLVKLRVATGAVSIPVLPVVWGISMTGCSPVSADKTGNGCLATSKNPELFCVIVTVTAWAGGPSVPRAKLIG